jgi:hypothetical protein
VVTAMLAMPLLLTAPVPILVVPLKKSTVPPGVPAPGLTAVTVAVKVTDWLDVEGLADEVIAVFVVALATVTLPAADVLEMNVASPWYCAVIGSVPTGNAEVDKMATPLLFNVPDPSRIEPLKNLTVPVGVPVAVVVTVAVSATGWPKTDEVGDGLTVVVDGVVPVTF